MSITPTTCTCTEGALPCELPAERRCYVCEASICEACSQRILLKGGWVNVCRCGPLCIYALRARRQREIVEAKS